MSILTFSVTLNKSFHLSGPQSPPPSREREREKEKERERERDGDRRVRRERLDDMIG